MSCHVTQKEEGFKSGRLKVEGGWSIANQLFEQGFVVAVAAGIMSVDEVVVAFHCHSSIVVFGMMVGIIEYLYFEFPLCQCVGIVVPVVEVKVNVTKFAQLGLWVELSQMRSLEYEDFDTVTLHDVKNLLLHIALMLVPVRGFLMLAEPWY